MCVGVVFTGVVVIGLIGVVLPSANTHAEAKRAIQDSTIIFLINIYYKYYTYINIQNI